MATFNGEQFLGHQMQSILEQLSPVDEIVISDDASSDRTLDLIDSACDARVKVARNKHRCGPVGNFQRAVAMARNEYVLFADQDDVWLPGKLEVCRQALARVDVVVTDCRVVNAAGEETSPSLFDLRGSGPGVLRNLYKNGFVGCCMGVRSDFLDKCLPFPRFIPMHDWWIGLMASAVGRVEFIQTPYLLYRRHATALSPTAAGTGYGPMRKTLNRVTLATLLACRIVCLTTRNWRRPTHDESKDAAQ